MRLIFIRHPQTQANVDGLIYGRTESGYSEGGRATIPGILKALQDVSVDAIISSPLQRTRHLAERIAADHGLREEDILIDHRMVEAHCGILENLTVEEAVEKYREEYNAMMEDYENYVIPGGESLTMVYERVAGFLEEIYSRYEAPRQQAKDRGETAPREKTVVVTAHSVVIHVALAYLLKLSLKEIWHIKIEPGAVVDLDYRYEFAMLQGLSGPFNIRDMNDHVS